MSNELERLKTTCLAQEAEIARLKQSLDDLKPYCQAMADIHAMTDFDMGWVAAHKRLLLELNRITGVNE